MYNTGINKQDSGPNLKIIYLQRIIFSKVRFSELEEALKKSSLILRRHRKSILSKLKSTH